MSSLEDQIQHFLAGRIDAGAFTDWFWDHAWDHGSESWATIEHALAEGVSERALVETIEALAT